MSHEARLRALEIELPEVPSPAGRYTHAVRTGALLFLAGKGPLTRPPGGWQGKVGAEIEIDTARECAREVGLVQLAVLRSELGSLDRVKRVVKVLGMVNAAPDFHHHPRVIDGFSELMVDVFGEAGLHARSAVGLGSLPFGIPVEIEAIVEVDS